MKKDKQDKLKELREKARIQILSVYVKLMKSGISFPTRNDLAEKGITRDKFRHYFNTIEGIRKAAKEAYPDAFSGSITESNINDIYEKSLKTISNKKRFFITCAISGQKVFKDALDSIDLWSKEEKGQAVILPSYDTAHNLDNEIEWFFEDRILKYPMAFGPMSLNSNFHISDFQVTAKQVNPLTGIGRMVQGGGSMIFGSPKQSLEYEAVSSADKYPHAGMSSGAITLPNYKTSRGNSLRSAWIADKDHVLGGVIVEIVDDKIYHFRQVQFDKNGGFCDITGKYYLKNKSYKIDEYFKMSPKMVRGDIHAGSHDIQAVKASEDIIKKLKINEIAENDLFDGISVNHHIEHDVIERAILAEKDKMSLSDELEITAKILKRSLDIGVTKINVIPSNHDDFLARYLRRGAFVNEPQNFSIGCKLASSMTKGLDPLIEGLKDSKVFDNFDALVKDKVLCFPGINDNVKYGTFHIVHGHIAKNGMKSPSKAALEKGWLKVIAGHSHTPGKLRNVFQVGLLAKRRQGYNKGPSSWMHNVAIWYPNDTVTLINIIDGKWKR